MLDTPKGRDDTALDAPDPHSSADAPRDWLSWASHAAIVGIFIILLTMALSLARGVLRPIAAAIIVVVMLGPVARRLVGRRFPPLLFAILVVSVIVALIHIATIVLSGPVAELITVLPTTGPVIAQKFAVFDSFFSGLRRLQDWLAAGGGTSAFRVDLGSVMQAVAAYLTPALGELVVFLATLFLALVSRDNLRRNMILASPDQEERLKSIQILNEIELRLTRYIGTVTAINLSLGLVTALLCWLVGLPSPALFGLLAFVANFVPYIGPALTLAALLIAGLVTFPQLTDALIAPAVFLAVTTVEGQLITPSLIGQSITASPLAVFLALVFWIWLWGPVGGFLSVPFLIVGYSVLARLKPRTEPDLPG